MIIALSVKKGTGAGIMIVLPHSFMIGTETASQSNPIKEENLGAGSTTEKISTKIRFLLKFNNCLVY